MADESAYTAQLSPAEQELWDKIPAEQKQHLMTILSPGEVSDVMKMQFPMRGPPSWGTFAWAVPILFLLSYPLDPTPKQQEDAREFVQKWFPMLIPCGNCRAHFTSLHAPHVGDAVRNRATLARWFVDAHNEVNRRTGKPELSFEEAMKRWSRFSDAAVAARAVLDGALTLPAHLRDEASLSATASPASNPLASAIPGLLIALVSIVVLIVVIMFVVKKLNKRLPVPSAQPTLRAPVPRSALSA